MLISKCCKGDFHSEGDTTQYNICDKCDKPCDTIPDTGFEEGKLYGNNGFEVESEKTEYIDLDLELAKYQQECMKLFVNYQQDQLELLSNFRKGLK